MEADRNDALYLAVHEMLVVRVLHGQESFDFLKAMNRVIEVHDEMADSICHGRDVQA